MCDCAVDAYSPAIAIYRNLVVMALFLLSLFAVPTLRGYQTDAQARDVAAAMLSTLSFARMEAMRRNHEVQVCASADGETCTPGVSWDAGWVVLAKGQPLRMHAAVTQISQISATPAVAEAISFAADGRATFEGSVVFAFRSCLRGARADRLISVVESGRTAISKSICP